LEVEVVTLRVREVDASRAGRASLRAQIARLEDRLGSVFYELGIRRRSLPVPAGSRHEPRLLSLGELEAIRDDLVAQVADAEWAMQRCTAAESEARSRLERMLTSPSEHRYEFVHRSELGEPGCGSYHVRPRLGLLGMLFDWWCVKLSSGCP
jgi:hypothetical protein